MYLNDYQYLPPGDGLAGWNPFKNAKKLAKKVYRQTTGKVVKETQRAGKKIVRETKRGSKKVAPLLAPMMMATTKIASGVLPGVMPGAMPNDPSLVDDYPPTTTPDMNYPYMLQRQSAAPDWVTPVAIGGGVLLLGAVAYLALRDR